MSGFKRQAIARLVFMAGCIATCVSHASAQFTGRFAVTMSFAPGSGGGISPADIIVFNSNATGGGGVQWSGANLGLAAIASPNVDAFSDGTDYVAPPSTLTCTDVLIEYTVTAGSAGALGSLVELEKGDDGASSDVFSKLFHGATENQTYVANDHQNISSGAQIDALAWQERSMYPVFFSVDGPTANALSAHLGSPIRPADILTVSAPGAIPTVFRSHASLGLSVNDDIDALAVDHYKNGTIFISLTSTSPAFGGASTYPAKLATAAGLIAYEVGGVAMVYKYPSELDLLDTDDLTAVRISDPCLASFQGMTGTSPYAGLVDGNEPSPTTPHPWNYETIRIDNHIGNAPRHVWVESTDPPFALTIRTQFPAQIALVWVGYGSICTAFASTKPIPIAKGFLAFPVSLILDPVVPGNPGVLLNVPAAFLPLGLDINLQGIVYTGAPNEYFMTNVVTVTGVP